MLQTQLRVTDCRRLTVFRVVDRRGFHIVLWNTGGHLHRNAVVPAAAASGDCGVRPPAEVLYPCGEGAAETGGGVAEPHLCGVQ